MALGIEILDVKATKMSATEDPKTLAARCPRANFPMHMDPEHGVHVVTNTGLSPIWMLQSVRQWNAGEVHGLIPEIAKQIIAQKLGMELIGAGAVKRDPDDEMAKEKATKAEKAAKAAVGAPA